MTLVHPGGIVGSVIIPVKAPGILPETWSLLFLSPVPLGCFLAGPTLHTLDGSGSVAHSQVSRPPGRTSPHLHVTRTGRVMGSYYFVHRCHVSWGSPGRAAPAPGKRKIQPALLTIKPGGRSEGKVDSQQHLQVRSLPASPCIPVSTGPDPLAEEPHPEGGPVSTLLQPGRTSPGSLS